MCIKYQHRRCVLQKILTDLDSIDQSNLDIVGKKRKMCGQCTGCKQEDCGLCKSCHDMKKFGGTGKRKQGCVKRRCLQPALSKQVNAITV